MSTSDGQIGGDRYIYGKAPPLSIPCGSHPLIQPYAILDLDRLIVPHFEDGGMCWAELSHFRHISSMFYLLCLLSWLLIA
jgi:hypothetical protein